MSDIAAIVSAICGVIAAVVAILGFVFLQAKNLREAVQSGDRATEADCLRAIDIESKARHVLANASQQALNLIRSDVETLKRDSVRKDDMTAMDTRWNATFNRLEAKLDRLGDQMAQLPSLEVSIKGCGERISEMMKRLDARP